MKYLFFVMIFCFSFSTYSQTGNKKDNSDGKSKDNTIQVAKSNNCKVINQKGLGYGDAIIKGVNSVKMPFVALQNIQSAIFNFITIVQHEIQ